jgi:hypothetical protein
MVPDLVPLRHGGGYGLLATRYTLGDQEECRSRAVLVQQAEDLRSVCPVGTVIERERDYLLARRN